MFIRKKIQHGHLYYSLETRVREGNKVKSITYGGLGRNPYTGLKLLLDNNTIDLESYNRMIERLKQDDVKDTCKTGYFIPEEDLLVLGEEIISLIKTKYKPIDLDFYE